VSKKGRRPPIALFPVEEILPYTISLVHGQLPVRDGVLVDGKIYCVKMQSDKFDCFRINTKCVVCQLEGTLMGLDLQGNNTPHFNLYAQRADGTLVLMTKDHIVPRSRGGEDHIDNYQTMCEHCNCLKQNHPLTIQGLRTIRSLFGVITSAQKLVDQSQAAILDVCPEYKFSGGERGKYKRGKGMAS